MSHSVIHKACPPTAVLVSQVPSIHAPPLRCPSPSLPPLTCIQHSRTTSWSLVSPPCTPPPHLHQVLQHCLMVPPRSGKGDQLLHAPVSGQQRASRAGVQGLERGPAGQEDAQGGLLRLGEGRSS